MTREFKKLVIYGHDYPTWVMDIKISLALRGMYKLITPLVERQQELLPTYQYNAL
jgi:hypothetical protein